MKEKADREQREKVEKERRQEEKDYYKMCVHREVEERKKCKRALNT